MNLVINARDAMADGGELAVRTENVTLGGKCCQTLSGAVPGEYVLLAVSDTGMGMDRDVVKHIFVHACLLCTVAHDGSMETSPLCRRRSKSQRPA